MLQPREAWCRVVTGVAESEATGVGKGATGPRLDGSTQFSAVTGSGPKAALPHFIGGGCVHGATHRQEVISLIELVAQGRCFESLDRFLKAGLLLALSRQVSASQRPCAFAQRPIFSLSFWCLPSHCLDLVRSFSSDPGQTLVMGEHLAHFLLGVSIALSSWEGLASPAHHGVGPLLWVLGAGILDSISITIS